MDSLEKAIKDHLKLEFKKLPKSKLRRAQERILRMISSLKEEEKEIPCSNPSSESTCEPILAKDK